MIWLAAICISCIGTELLLRLPIAPSTLRIGRDSARVGRIIFSPSISDHWKEKVAPVYALRMGRQTLALAGYFAILAAVVSACLIAAALAVPDVALFLSSLTGLSFSIAISILYWQMKHRLAGS